MGTRNRPTDGVKEGGMCGKLIKATGESCHDSEAVEGYDDKWVVPEPKQPGRTGACPGP